MWTDLTDQSIEGCVWTDQSVEGFVWTDQSVEGCVWTDQSVEGCVWTDQSVEGCVWTDQSVEGCVWMDQSVEGCVWCVCVQIALSLKDGIGISLVNSLPEELVYITLRNIQVEITSRTSQLTVNASVAEVKVRTWHRSMPFVFSGATDENFILMEQCHVQLLH